jgi:hypothetical protein
LKPFRHTHVGPLENSFCKDSAFSCLGAGWPDGGSPALGLVTHKEPAAGYAFCAARNHIAFEPRSLAVVMIFFLRRGFKAGNVLPEEADYFLRWHSINVLTNFHFLSARMI